MTAFEDLQPIDYFPVRSEKLLAVGWLERGVPYSTGPVDGQVHDRLRELLHEPFQPFAIGGVHPCSLCRFRAEATGTLNLFVPGDGVLFVAPELITHYINVHDYAPPEVFAKAVLSCPDTRSIAYKRLFLANAGREVVDQLKEARYALAPGVEEEIRRVFQSKDVPYVRRRLASTKLWAERSGPPSRVHVAVIWLSRGDRQLFDQALDQASCDWRDTLTSAGLEHENWREVIMARGVDLRDPEAV